MNVRLYVLYLKRFVLWNIAIEVTNVNLNNPEADRSVGTSSPAFAYEFSPGGATCALMFTNLHSTAII